MLEYNEVHSGYGIHARSTLGAHGQSIQEYTNLHGTKVIFIIAYTTIKYINGYSQFFLVKSVLLILLCVTYHNVNTR